jgi:hypothetical protein
MVNLNNTGKLGNIMEIRIAQLQYNEWLAFNPLTNWPYYNPLHFKTSIIAQILCVLNNWEINIKWNKSNFINFEGNLPLSYILKDNNYRKYKDKLREKNLMFLDQLREGYFLLQWDQLSLKNKFNQQGVISNWWKIIEKIVIPENSRFLKEKFQPHTDGIFESKFEQLLMYTKIDKRKNNWIITKRSHQDLNKNVIAGILKNESWDPYNDFIKIIHYKFHVSDSTNLRLTKCAKRNCDIGIQDNQGNCIITCRRSNSL